MLAITSTYRKILSNSRFLRIDSVNTKLEQTNHGINVGYWHAKYCESGSHLVDSGKFLGEVVFLPVTTTFRIPKRYHSITEDFPIGYECDLYLFPR